MDSFVCVKKYEGKNIVAKEVTIEEGEILPCNDKFILYKGAPLCASRSQIAKDYFVWNDNFERRYLALKVILDKNRVRYWKEKVTLRDENGVITKISQQTLAGRYTPKEIDYIRIKFPTLVENVEGLHFNDYFYRGSNVETLERMAEYLRNSV